MSRRRTLALAVALVLATVLIVTVSGVPFALADGPPDGMVGVSDDAIGSDLPACDGGDSPGSPPDNAGGGNPICGVHEDLQEHSVYTSAHADTLNITVTNPGQAKQYTNGSVFGSGPIAIVFSDDAHSDGRDVALPTEVIEEIFGYLPKLARGTHEDGEQWASPIAYKDGYAVFEIPHFSDQVVTMEGEISLSSDSALAGDTFTYEIENGSSVDNLTFELTGVDHIESASTIQELANGESFTHDVGGNQPSGTATLSLEGSTDIQQGTYSGTATSSDSFNLNATAGGQLTEITLTGNEETRSESTSISGTSESISIGGTSSASNFGVTVQGSWDYSTYEGSYQSPSYNDVHYNCDMGSGEFADCPTDYSGDVSHLDDPKIHNLVVDVTDVSGGGDIAIAIYQGGTYDLLLDKAPTDETTYNLGDYDLASGSFQIVVEAGAYRTAHYSFDKIDGISEKTQGVSVSIDGDTKSLGNLNDGETASATFSSVGTGSQTLSVSTSAGSAYLTSSATWDEQYAVVNPTVSVAGEEVLNFDGTLLDGQTTTETLDTPIDLNEGSNSVTIDQQADIDLGWEADVDEIWATENPSVDVGGTNYNHTGVLEEGDSVSWDLGSGFEDNISVSNAQIDEGTVIVNLTVDEVTQTKDPTITINGNHTVSYNGTLTDGETVDLSNDASLDWVEEGQNNISVSAVSPSVSGPAGKVGINWRHSGDASKTVTHSGEVFSEVSTIEHTWVEDQSDATITVDWASDRIIRLGELTVTHNGSEITDPSYSFSESDIIVNVGSVQAGETTKIDLTGWKITTENGDIKVTSPTDEGAELVTTFEVTNATAEPLKLNVGGHGQGHLLHNLDDDTDVPADWDIRIYADGSQTVRLPDVSVGDSIRIETTDLEVDPASGDVVLEPIDADEPRFETAPGTTKDDTLEVIWHDTTSGHVYELEDLTNNEAIETAKASSPVSFTVKDVERTLRIIDLGEPGSGGGSSDPGPSPPPTAPIDAQTSSIFGLPAFFVLILAIAGAFGGLYVVSRSTGDDTPIDAPNVPVVSDALSRLQVPPILRRPRGGFTFGQLLLLLGAVSIMLVSVELVTARSVFEMVTPSAIPTGDLVLLGGAVSLLLSVWLLHSRTGINLPDWLLWTTAGIVSVGTILVLDDGIILDALGLGGQANELLVVIVGIGILLALWQLDSKTTESIPLPILVAAGGITVVYVLETIQPGVILGGLSEGFATVSPLFWLIVIVGGAYFARGYLKAQRAPDTQIQLQLEGGNN